MTKYTFCYNVSHGIYCYFFSFFRQEKLSFPVKLTDPVTAILYITSDKAHMEELKHTIHVKEIALGKHFFHFSGRLLELIMMFNYHCR